MESGTLKFVARDEFNNEITTGGDGNPLVVSAIQTKPTVGSLLTNVATLSDNEDGTYIIVYTLPTGEMVLNISSTSLTTVITLSVLRTRCRLLLQISRQCTRSRTVKL